MPVRENSWRVSSRIAWQSVPGVCIAQQSLAAVLFVIPTGTTKSYTKISELLLSRAPNDSWKIEFLSGFKKTKSILRKFQILRLTWDQILSFHWDIQFFNLKNCISRPILLQSIDYLRKTLIACLNFVNYLCYDSSQLQLLAELCSFV